jgi:hypothetical protein
MEIIKRMIVRWAVKQIKKLPKEATYYTLEQYGICDIIIDPYTSEKYYYFI